jgi:hypothetical protein
MSLLENFSTQEKSVSKISGLRATKVFYLRPCMTSEVRALKEHDLFARINFCNWFLQLVHNEEFDPHLVLLSNEAWLSWRGEVNSLTASTAYRTSILIHEYGVWSGMNAHRKISTFFGQELHRVTASILTVDGQEGKLFSSCCSTGEFLLRF